LRGTEIMILKMSNGKGSPSQFKLKVKTSGNELKTCTVSDSHSLANFLSMHYPFYMFLIWYLSASKKVPWELKNLSSSTLIELFTLFNSVIIS
jgi:hypothetical protein